MIAPQFLGRCLNAGRCGLAGQRGPIPIAGDVPRRCPECKSDLIAFGPTLKKVDPGDNRITTPKMLLLPGMLLTLLIVIGIRYDLFGGLDLGTPPPLPVDGGAILVAPPNRVRSGASVITYDELAPMLWQGFLADQGCAHVKHSTTRSAQILGCETAGAPTITISAPETALGVARNAMKAYDVLLTTDDRFGIAPASDRPAFPDKDGVIVHDDVVGIDALVVVVHPSNPIARLSQPQLADIFLGRITDFAAVGGRPGSIAVIAPTGSARANDRLAAIVPQWLPLTPRARRLQDSDAIVAAVLADPHAIGVAERRGAGAARILAIGPATGMAVAPTPLTLISGDYPLARAVHMVRFNRDDSFYETRFVAFTHSLPGRKLITAAGFEPIRRDRFAVSAAAGAPAAYRRLVAYAERIAVDLRFRPASLDLDPRSLADLDSVAARLAGDRVAGARIAIIGLSDPALPNAASDAASLARRIATLLGERGIAAAVPHGLGGIIPVAEPALGNRNRRVEIWLSPAQGATPAP